MWKREGLDPNIVHTILIQHVSWPGFQSLIFDRIVVTGNIVPDQGAKYVSS
jgi:hypothetical protein